MFVHTASGNAHPGFTGGHVDAQSALAQVVVLLLILPGVCTHSACGTTFMYHADEFQSCLLFVGDIFHPFACILEVPCNT